MQELDWEIVIAEEEIAKRYAEAPRFDEGEIYQSWAYDRSADRKLQIFDTLIATFGDRIIAMLDDYTAALYDEMELEAQHFFREGCRAGKRDGAKSE